MQRISFSISVFHDISFCLKGFVMLDFSDNQRLKVVGMYQEILGNGVFEKDQKLFHPCSASNMREKRQL